MKFREYVNEDNLDEGIFTIAGGIIVGLIGLKILKSIVKKVLGTIGLNAKAGPEKLKEVTDNIVQSIIKEHPEHGYGAIQVKNLMYGKIDSGEITTLKQILPAIGEAAEAVMES